jgi:hypothetical protein
MSGGSSSTSNKNSTIIAGARPTKVPARDRPQAVATVNVILPPEMYLSV